MAERFIHIGAVGELVHYRLGVCPEPCNWPEQSAKAKREQTEAMNRVGLWMLFLMSDFFRHDVDQPENGDADNRRDHEHDPRDAIGDRIERLAVEHRGVRGLRKQRCTEQDEREHHSEAAPSAGTENGRSCFHGLGDGVNRVDSIRA